MRGSQGSAARLPTKTRWNGRIFRRRERKRRAHLIRVSLWESELASRPRPAKENNMPARGVLALGLQRAHGRRGRGA
jgi:hypothetical protein